MDDLEETWSPDPVKAWRYFGVGPLTWNWTDDRWEVTLNGDVEEWSGPVKYAGHHVDVEEHDSPHLGCMCGVNAVKNLETHEIAHRTGMWCSCWWMSPGNQHPQRAVVLAPVELAGIVDEYEKGYRAQQATIVGPMVAINVTSKQAEVLSKAYGVEVTTDWYPFFKKLEIEEARNQEAGDGHRKADPANHRGTGTSQGTGADSGARKGWRKVKNGLIAVAQFLGVAVVCLVVVGGLALLTAQIDEWRNGAEQDAECVTIANQTGGSARELGTFGDCRVLLPNGILLWRSSIQWADSKSISR